VKNREILSNVVQDGGVSRAHRRILDASRATPGFYRWTAFPALLAEPDTPLDFSRDLDGNLPRACHLVDDLDGIIERQFKTGTRHTSRKSS
jgi:hypothetical protein